MTAEILTFPCLADNYAFLLHDTGSGQTALVDAPESYPVQRALEGRGWALDTVLLTHHHWDHIDALPELRETFRPQVIGAAADAARLPPLDQRVTEGDSIRIGDLEGTVIDVSGHTNGHVAYYFPAAKALFTGDSLMALGCGRLFEGDAPTMWDSLSKLAALPADTLVYSGHEYTAANAAFALTIEPENPALQARIKDITAKRAKGLATVPSSLAEELATNPFLRAGDPAIKAALGMDEAPDAEVFAEIRRRKDSF